MPSSRVLMSQTGMLVGFRGPGRAWVHWRDHLWRLALCVSAFLIEGRKELRDCARLALGCRPVNLAWSLAMITAGIGFDDACIGPQGAPARAQSVRARVQEVYRSIFTIPRRRSSASAPCRSAARRSSV